MKTRSFFVFAAVCVGAAALRAQAPAPAQPDNVAAAVAALQQVKKANDETIAKQEATLKALEELQKASDQLRIFSKRG